MIAGDYRNPARLIMAEHGITIEDLARIGGASERAAYSWARGEREPADKVHYAIVREWGPAGRQVSGALARAREDWLAKHHVKPGQGRKIGRKPTPGKVVKRDKPREKMLPAYAFAGDEHDGKTYTIDEWKRLFGEPGGGGPDINGRFSGYFDTEPCWLGE